MQSSPAARQLQIVSDLRGRKVTLLCRGVRPGTQCVWEQRALCQSPPHWLGQVLSLLLNTVCASVASTPPSLGCHNLIRNHGLQAS